MTGPILPLSIITSFLSNLTIELLAEKISSWLAGLGDADRKSLNQAFKAICIDMVQSLTLSTASNQSHRFSY